jgi:hypothetical protein
MEKSRGLLIAAAMLWSLALPPTAQGIGVRVDVLTRSGADLIVAEDPVATSATVTFGPFESFGYGSLSQGVLRATVVGGRIETGSFPPFEERASASVDLSDQFTILGDVVAPVTGTLSLAISGLIAAAPLPTDCFFCGSQSDVLAQLNVRELSEVIPEMDFEQWVLRNQLGDPPAVSIVGEILSVPFEVTPASRSFELRALLIMNAYGTGSVADFGNTAFLSIDLPEGLSFTSASGVLLTEQPSNGVPEPGSLALVGMAALSMMVAARCRKRSRLMFRFRRKS